MEVAVWREVCEVGGVFGRWCGVGWGRKEAEEEEGKKRIVGVLYASFFLQKYIS